MCASELESLAHQQDHDDQHLGNDEDMVVEELAPSTLPKVRNTKEDSFPDFTAGDSCDSPLIGESSTKRQAQGSNARMLIRRVAQAMRTNTKEDSFSDFTDDDSCDSPLIGESSTKRQAQGSNARMLIRRVARAMWTIGSCSNSLDGEGSQNVMGLGFYPVMSGVLIEIILNMRRANMPKTSSWISALTFPMCLFLSNHRHPPFSEQRSCSIWFALLGMLNLAAFLSSLSFMVISGARFTRMQITALVISALVMNTYTSVSTMPFYVSVLGMLFAGSFVRA